MTNEELLADVLQDRARMQEQIKQLFRQMTELRTLTESVQKLAVNLEKQGAALGSMAQKVDALKNDVDDIKARPSRRWEAAVAALISGLVGFALARLGLK